MADSGICDSTGEIGEDCGGSGDAGVSAVYWGDVVEY